MRGLLAALLALLVPHAASGGAWVRSPGEIYLKSSVSYLSSREVYDARAVPRPLLGAGDAYTDGRYREIASTLYVEYGLSGAVTVVGSSALKQARLEGKATSGGAPLSESATGPGDLRLGVRWRFRSRSPVGSLETDLKLPLSSPVDRREFQPDFGTGAVDLGGAIEIGGGLNLLRGYWTGGGGYRLRGGSAPAETFWDLEVGVEAGRRLRLRARYDGVDSRAETAVATGAGSAMQPVNSGGQDYQRIMPAVAWKLGGALEASLGFRRTLAGVGALRDSQWELGIAFQGRASAPPER